MNNLTLIAAIGKNYELGYKNELLLRIPEDMKFFRDTTWGKTIVMGRKTFESLPKILPNRSHVVLTRNKDFCLDDSIKTFYDISKLLSFLKYLDDDVFVIGGAQIYNELFPFADKMILTEIDMDFNLADCFFPSFNKDEWNSETILENSYNDIKYKRLVYTKK